MGRLSRKKVLDRELPNLVLVVCTNLKHSHERIFLRYIYWNYGFCIDEPTYEEVLSVAKETGQMEGWVVIEADCHYCLNGLPS